MPSAVKAFRIVEDLQSLDLPVRLYNRDETFSTRTSSEANAMTRNTTVFATLLSLGFTPVAAQNTDCDIFEAWVSSDELAIHRTQFWSPASLETVSVCLHSGQPVNARGRDGTSPLLEAAQWNDNPGVVTLLLSYGADINARDVDGRTPLHGAAQWNDNPEVLIVLLDSGADVNTRTKYGSTPLHSAAKMNSNPEVLTVLLDAGADATAVNEDGETPFDLAKNNDALVGTDAYWALNDARFE
jgi:hypothetical protein